MPQTAPTVKKNHTRAAALLVAGIFCLVIMAIVVFMNVKNIADMRAILEASVKSQLVSISVAAREIIDTDAFVSYNSVADVEADSEAYDETLARLRMLAREVGAEYIYALKMIDGVPYFVYDTDPKDEEIFIPYALSDVHAQAFAGQEAADVMNVDDIYGSFNTGAVPIWQDGAVVGIVSADIEDTYLAQSEEAAIRNTILLVVVLGVAMAALVVVVGVLSGKLRRLQKQLQRMAHYDTVTGLPNRQYLLEYLEEITHGRRKTPFALFFVDLDNFKTVNDNAGHDAGDALLRTIGAFLAGASDGAMAFRPAPGVLNIAARVGGDEFIQINFGIETEQQAAEAAEKLLADFKAQMMDDRHVKQYGVGLSIGVALYPYHSDNFHVLIKYADIAMYHAKRAGKSAWRVYSEDMAPKEEK